MNDVSFKIAFQLRNLLPVIEHDQHWCHCGMEMDTLTAHSYVCGNQSTRSKIRNPFHRRLCEVLKIISNDILKDAGMIALNGEPACADHLPLKPRANSLLNNIQNDEDNQLARKRADFGFSSAFKTILVDCTTASPLAKDTSIKLKDYKAGKAADEAVNRKIKDYKRYFKMMKIRDAIFSFLL